MAIGNSKRGTGKRKIKIEPSDDIEIHEGQVGKQAPPKKLRKTETYQPWRIAESDLSTTHEQAADHSKVGFVSVLTDEKELKLWWYDAYEKKAEGVVYLFGKALDKNREKYISCSVKIQSIQREVFVLPRTFRIDYNSNPTAQKVSMDDVKQEVSEILKKRNILKWDFGVCTKKYAFGIADIPSSAEYLVVKYSYNQWELPSTLSGQTFSHIFGTDTGPLEHVLLKCNIMGPCWLSFSEANFSDKKDIWCKINAKVKGLDNCKVLKDDKGVSITKGPPLTVMSLSLETTRNKLADSNEIIIASAFVCPQVDIDDTMSPESINCSRFSVARKLPDKDLPDNIHDAVTEVCNQKEHSIQLERTEMGLINYLLAKIHVIDPDVIVGHNFTGMQIEILLDRMKALKIPYWHKIGRMHAQKWPQLNANSDSFSQGLNFMSGRLLCDTYVASKDLINAKSYNLTELCKSQFNILRDEIKSEEVAQFYQSPHSLIDLIAHCSFDAYLSLKLMFKLQILPLTKQLTNLSGNKWSKSMYGARSNRNEHLLLHTFYNQGYVYPNKYAQYAKKKEHVASKIELDVNNEMSSQLQNTEQPSTTKFSGGLVLEPKTGYYDNYVILLDFNSLYPSIIQEYNVCFTTRNDLDLSQRADVEDDDDDNSNNGVLPALVKVLVQKRREIKSLMKDPNISESKKTQYDIQQMALKLTANSMYGCLGSSFSRFYAKDLAMFITFMGRTILKSTIDLAEEIGLNVIYGDTDSIMIDTKHSDFGKAKIMAKELKEKVNERYRLLEIGVDGYFKHTLLLKKKKYAALVIEEVKNGDPTETILSKGLDLVRRDWCDLSHDISGSVLKLILESESIQDITGRIFEYLKTVKDQVTESSYDLSKFVIRKRLNKPLSEYDDSKGYPHATVARKMRQTGMDVRIGDVVSYVMCIGYRKAIPTIPEDVLVGDANLDINWYLSQQILPPVSRLCSPLHDVTNKQLVSALGIIDTKDLQETVIKQDPDDEMNDQKEEDDILMNGAVLKMNEMEKNSFILHCSKCLESNTYDGPIRRDHNNVLMCGLLCSYCNKMSIGSIVTQVILEIRKNIDNYYNSPFICNSETCGTVAYDTEVMNNQSCPNVACRGKLVRKFSDNQLYSRLTYLYSLFDTATIKLENYRNSESGIVSEIIEQYSSSFITIKDSIEGYREKSSFRFIRFFDVLDEEVKGLPISEENDRCIPKLENDEEERQPVTKNDKEAVVKMETDE